jgi:hypothetical protein
VCPAPRGHEDEEDPADRNRRRAGCIWQFFSEQWLILGLTLAAALFGRAYLVGRARRLRARRSAEEHDDG